MCSKLLNSTSCMLDTANDLNPVGSSILSNSTSTPGVWYMSHHLLLSEGSPSKADVDTVMKGPGENTTANESVRENTVIPGQGKVPTINEPCTEQVSVATQVRLSDNGFSTNI